MNAPIALSEKAQAEIKHIIEKKNIPEGYGLRVGVKGGGCAVGFILGFDKPKEGDHTYEIGGITVHVQKREMLFLAGKEVDFYEGSDARGFVFVDQETKESTPSS